METKKRKYSARTSRGVESASKRTATPEHPSQLAPPPPESLPTKITPGKALPTVDDVQLDNLSSNEYQSISESGVLAESLHRSRQKWLSEGIFERYWTKPVKKKGTPSEPPNNPDKSTMSKLGPCSITIEPHIFECNMFIIKEPARPFTLPPAIQQQFRPIMQYGPPGGLMPPPAPVAAKPIFPAAATKAQTTPLKNVGSANQTNTPAVNGSGLPAQNNSAPSPGSAQAPATRTADPVIQMLAERAATDAELKALMRIVANGEASPEELKKFQNHIDDLTSLLKSRQAAIQSTNQSPQPRPSDQLPKPPNNSALVNGPALANGLAKVEPIPALIDGPAPVPAPKQNLSTAPSPAVQHMTPQPQALRSKGPVPTQKSDISGIVFEFPGGSGDRFLFPKFSILEYLPGGQVIASFLIVRKGSSSDSPSYDRELDYYQPITIRLYTHQGRHLEQLQKVVAPPDEVRRYMDDVMDNMTRAEYLLLAMRLPKEKVQHPEREGQSMQIDTPEVQNTETPVPAAVPVLWPSVNAPSVPAVVQRLPPSKRLLTEEEKYQSFITSVSTTT